MKDSLTFIIPVYNDNPSELIEKISTLFSNYRIIIIDDGANIKKNFQKTLIIKNSKNIGLVKSLLSGYAEALKYNSKYIIRIDADGEYPIESVNNAIAKMNDNCRFSLIGFKRTISSNGPIDAFFNTLLGYIEGKFLTNHKFPQHAPSLQVFEHSLLDQIFSKLQSYVERSYLSWGLDLVSVAYASKLTSINVIESRNPDWYERRPIKKILSQLKSSLLIIYKFSTNQL